MDKQRAYRRALPAFFLTVGGAAVGAWVEGLTPELPVIGAILGAIAGLMLAGLFYMVYQRPLEEEEDYRRSLAGDYSKAQEQVSNLKQQVRTLETRVFRRQIEVDVHDIGGVIADLDLVYLFLRLTITNRNKPSALRDFMLTLAMADGRKTAGWYLEPARDGATLAAIQTKHGLVPSDDIREKATAAFGNHQEKTGWLLAYFPGIKRTDLDPIAGQQLLVTFRDVDEKRHGVAVEFRYCKPGLHHIPGLGVPEVAKPVGVPLTTVHRRHFRNEAVLLDGHKYVECLFEDCAFKFNGKPYEIERGRRVGNHHVVTDNPVVNQTLKLVTELMTAIPLKPEGKIGNGEDEAERRTGLVGDAGWACADCGAYHINEDLWGRLLQNGEVGDMCPTCGFPPRGTSTIGGILAIGPRS